LSVSLRTFFAQVRNIMILSSYQYVCGIRAQLFSVAAFILLFHGGSLAATAGSLTFAGVAFSPGSTVKANVPLSAQEKSLAGQGGNAVPPNAVATLATPSNFDPRKSWPVLVVCSTSDFKRQNRDDLVQFYRSPGLHEGWVVLAGDGPQNARNDTAAWRGAMTLAAVAALHHSFPGSDKWPVACAGFSGGGKGVGYVAPLLAKNGCRIAGIYITGANEDHLTDGYARIQPGVNFLNTPIYISAGHDDRIATVEQQYTVAGSIKRTGFNRMRIGTFHGGHEVNDGQTSVALGWFHQLTK
jgi:surfactin synthase thioesterase subunit